MTTSTRTTAPVTSEPGMRPGGESRFRRSRDSYSTVTDLARFLGLSMSRPSAFAVW